MSSLPVRGSSYASKVHERDVDILEDGSVVLSHEMSVEDVTLWKDEPYFSLTCDRASAFAEMTLSAYIEFSWGIILEELSFDLSFQAGAELIVTAEATAEYDERHAYQPDDLVWDIVNVPGWVLIGPALKFAIGAEVKASADVEVTAAQSVSLPDATLHLNALSWDETTSSGWDNPIFEANLTMSEKAELEINPFVDVGIEIKCEILSGALDLSGGVIAKSKFNNKITINGDQHIDESGNFSQPVEGEGCEQGVQVQSDFEFNLDAFGTQWWSDTIYAVTVPITEECYSWVPL